MTQPWSFTWLGTASAALWVPTSLLSLVAVKHIGISVGQSIWAGITVIVSFIWGVALLNELPSAVGLAIVGLLMIVMGIVGLSVCNTDVVKRLEQRRVGSQLSEQPLLSSDKVINEPAEAGPPGGEKKVFLVGLLVRFFFFSLSLSINFARLCLLLVFFCRRRLAAGAQMERCWYGQLHLLLFCSSLTRFSIR